MAQFNVTNNWSNFWDFETFSKWVYNKTFSKRLYTCLFPVCFWQGWVICVTVQACDNWAVTIIYIYCIYIYNILYTVYIYLFDRTLKMMPCKVHWSSFLWMKILRIIDNLHWGHLLKQFWQSLTNNAAFIVFWSGKVTLEMFLSVSYRLWFCENILKQLKTEIILHVLAGLQHQI